ncbi:MAG: hypothetical protein ABIX00_03535 [Polaromonas sp.]
MLTTVAEAVFAAAAKLPTGLVEPATRGTLLLGASITETPPTGVRLFNHCGWSVATTK